jgi:G protein-coupled receptor GPR1
LKAVWYFVFPVVVFVGGPVSSTSNFCQASGFLLAFAIEASDMAILLIAVHSALCILRSDSTIGESGLYRYRNWIYPMWLGPPLLAASLAFINNEEGYTLAGTFCYLPKRPFWYRLALSWVPRYLILSLILIMYVWIYIYGESSPERDCAV